MDGKIYKSLQISFIELNPFVFQRNGEIILKSHANLPTYIIIPGKKLLPDGELKDVGKDRIDAGIEVYDSYVKMGRTPKIILTGGNLEKTGYTEADAASNYIDHKGRHDIERILETKSVDTFTNVLHSLMKVKKESGDKNSYLVHLVTSEYQIFRMQHIFYFVMGFFQELPQGLPPWPGSAYEKWQETGEYPTLPPVPIPESLDLVSNDSKYFDFTPVKHPHIPADDIAKIMEEEYKKISLAYSFFELFIRHGYDPTNIDDILNHPAITEQGFIALDEHEENLPVEILEGIDPRYLF